MTGFLLECPWAIIRKICMLNFVEQRVKLVGKLEAKHGDEQEGGRVNYGTHAIPSKSRPLPCPTRSCGTDYDLPTSTTRYSSAELLTVFCEKSLRTQCAHGVFICVGSGIPTIWPFFEATSGSFSISVERPVAYAVPHHGSYLADEYDFVKQWTAVIFRTVLQNPVAGLERGTLLSSTRR
ncbi:hypothetical protein OE88DRAFT_1647564 [Heliocybe sulcata]|uniref:Uncharacterized protein n=1 Tax=Heliocybe sulcata TaxID=5364 RepID=A0A5C3MTL8_9AGAM|nr:hypothetical protein OE88DRAFT_1647564 [Heliocybe sulcata]